MASFLLPAIAYFVGLILLAHFFAPPGYTWMENTISDLGSQGHTHQWIMQAGFIGFGLLLAGGLAFKFRAMGQINPPDSLMLVYGLSILLTGFFCAPPLDSSLPINIREGQLHSLFATLAGVALSVAILWYAIAAPTPTQRITHIVFVLLIVGISATFGLAESGTLAVGKGLVQRVLYAVAFIWLLMI
jgi:hypothetical membrane protein